MSIAPIDPAVEAAIAAPTSSTDPTARSHRWEIVQKGDGLLFVRTINLWNGAIVSLHAGYLNTVEEAHAEIAAQKARFAASWAASQETIIHTEEE